MNDPVANCFRFAKIEHGGMVARGSNEAQEPSYPKRMLTPEKVLELRAVLKQNISA